LLACKSAEWSLQRILIDKPLGHWPLPVLADGCALHTTRTKGLLQSGSENTQKNNPLIRGFTGGDLGFQPLGAEDLFLTALSTGMQVKRAFASCLHMTLCVAPDPKVLKDLGVGANSGWLT